MKSLTANQVKVGFIGLGNMGSRIAQRLLEHDYQVCVYDVDPAKAEPLVAQGGTVARSIADLVRGVDVVISCLTNDQIVYSVYTAAEGVFAGARPGTVVLEMSTISPESSRELHRLRARNGIEVLDVAPKPEAPAPTRFAPVSISPFTSAVTSNSALAVGTVYYTSRLVTTRLSTLTLKIIDLQSDRFGTHIAFNVCMLKVSVVEGRKRRWLVVEGRLVAPWSDELRAACERAASGLDGRELVIDLKNLTTISEQGADLLLKLRQQGLKCRGCGVFTKEILKQVARRLRRNGAHE